MGRLPIGANTHTGLNMLFLITFLSSALGLLLLQYFTLRDDLKFEKRAYKTETQILQDRLARARQARDDATLLAGARYTALKKWRRRYRSAVKQAKIWSQRAMSRGFSRREHKDAVRLARQKQKEGKLHLVHNN